MRRREDTSLKRMRVVVGPRQFDASARSRLHRAHHLAQMRNGYRASHSRFRSRLVTGPRSRCASIRCRSARISSARPAHDRADAVMILSIDDAAPQPDDPSQRAA